MDNRPIGVFDSGLGGLTAVKELMRILPHEHMLYFGDKPGQREKTLSGRDSNGDYAIKTDYSASARAARASFQASYAS